ncbi:uncharacterized protein LOC133173868 [Saccostrea echinata]|uniref:uncharacterized protein LOC133173868 n=1 Tax=Saccostrea echinata TaxID=191078 RepID=UPI002A814DA3|nr:uncharacterized protein LOC133173868 [Saccostrea echinata]
METRRKRKAPGRKDSKESGGKPQPNGVGQEHIVEKDAVYRPVGRGRGRGRAHNRGSGSGNDPGRVMTYSGEDGHVDCKKDLLVIKVDNTPGTKSDQVEVEYSDGENEAHSGDHTAAHHKKAGPHAEELWWDEEGDDIGLELQGIPAEDDIFEQKDLFNDYHGEGYDKNGHFEDARGQTSQGDADEWEDCTTSEDFSTDRSQSQTSVSDDLTSPLKVNLNPDAPVFTPASQTSPSPLAAKVSKEQKIEKASLKEKKTKELKVGDRNISKNKEEKAPLDSKKEKTEHSKSDTDHSDSGKAVTKPEESSLAPSEEELKGEVFEKPTMADSHTTQEEPPVKADTNPDDKGQSDENQNLIDPPTDMLPKEEADQDDTKKNSQSETVDAEKQKPEVEDETDSHDDIAQEAIEERMVATPVYQYFSDECCFSSDDSFRDPDFLCSKSEVERSFSSDSDDESDTLFRHKKRKLEHNVNKAKKRNLNKNLEEKDNVSDIEDDSSMSDIISLPCTSQFNTRVVSKEEFGLLPKGKIKEGCKQTYDKQNYCTFCSKNIKSKISRHILTHKLEPKVMKILSLPKRSEERKVELELLANEGNFKHNLEVLKKKEGLLVVARRESQLQHNPMDFLPCDCENVGQDAK